MRKRKPFYFSPRRWLATLAIVGLVSVVTVTVGELVLWGLWQGSNGRSPTPTPTSRPVVIIYQTKVPYAFPVPIRPTSTRMPIHPATVLSQDLILNRSGYLALLANGTVRNMFPNSITGDGMIRKSPTQDVIAYKNMGKLHLINVASGHDDSIDIAGVLVSMSWSPDGKALSFIIHKLGWQTLYRTSPSSIYPIEQLSMPTFAAPPVWHPSTHRLLIAEPADNGKTMLYTIDGNCEAIDQCRQTREDFMVLPYRTNWLDYQPSGLYLVSAEQDRGELYLIGTAKRDYQRIFNDGLIKRQPTFSSDGTQIAYLSSDRQLYLADLATMSSELVYAANNEIVRADGLSWR